MVEKLFYVFKNENEKIEFPKAVMNEIALKKKCYIRAFDSDEDVSYFQKYEVLRDGISFELEEAIPELSCPKRGIASIMKIKPGVNRKGEDIMRVDYIKI